MNELALFAGAGGGLLASRLLGWSTVAACEIDPYARAVLLRRQSEGHLERFPIWDDVRTFDGRPWRGIIDVISGGFPCQDISAAGKGAGLAGSRSGLWFEYLRIVDEVRPEAVFAENSPLLRTRGLGTVLQGLTRLGYDSCWGVLGAGHIGAPHRRDRMWVVAVRKDTNPLCLRPQRLWTPPKESWTREQLTGLLQTALRVSVPSGSSGGVVDVVANRVDQLRALGNGQVPTVAALAWEVLSAGFAKGGLS